MTSTRFSFACVVINYLLKLVPLILLLPATTAYPQSPRGFDRLGRGINYGNMLEAPSEGAWGLHFEDRYPALVRLAGFDHVRIPVRWSSHSLNKPPYTIEPNFLERVHKIVDLNLSQGLKVILNTHHFEELYAEPEQNRMWLLAIWKQLSDEFQGAEDGLYFEILNEPHGELDQAKWNSMLADTMAEIRKLHPDRWVVIGPAPWNNLHGLESLRLPQSDRKLIVTVHYYLPFPFTHQGASWVEPSPPTGVAWSGSDDEVAAMQSDFRRVAEWASKQDRPVYIGEFGTYQAAPMESRVRWTQNVRSFCEQEKFGWGYWELASGFGVFDHQAGQWRSELLNALIPNEKQR